ncbi:cell division protein ZipA C-terminal FtsZ-binding domain-containing protein [Leeia sp. TBRC 13508]|uniref:Cell division protein ZipA n=1 Tax=Leeia speluncae TaxID=2884804 RepID=A0ABS8D215_9NEIS|nr:cell division protein ZipA C-terminal FtsZ-binding domain-containing protein [Leeia speluncae]MCB6182224.1 cell division protein ZipA C-terminal FtsZ-binding domain-containing protein [Leeia speluncae]
MTDLQLVLLGVGAIVILLVVLYNWWDQQRYKKRAQAAFASYQQDVLLDPSMTPMDADTRMAGEDDLPDDDALATARRQTSTNDEMTYGRPTIKIQDDRTEPVIARKEPVIQPKVEPAKAENNLFSPNAASAAAPTNTLKTAREVLTYPSQQDEKADMLLEVLSHTALDVDLIRSLHRQLNRSGKRISWLALMSSGEWYPLDVDANLAIMGLKIGVQMADRRGPLDEPSLRQMVGALETFAAETGSELRLPSLAHVLANAQKLDTFCADVDVTIGLNVFADSMPFSMMTLRDHMERNGLRLMADGAYHMVNDKGVHLFSVINFDNSPFPAHPSPKDTSEGVTFLFDVPRVADGINVFGLLSDLAFELSSQLGARLVDDNRRPLTDHGIASIRQQLRAIYGTMNLKGIEPGGQTALRLFS